MVFIHGGGKYRLDIDWVILYDLVKHNFLIQKEISLELKMLSTEKQIKIIVWHIEI